MFPKVRPCDEEASSTRLSKNITHLSEQLRCYSVVRPIMRASHARDWGSNPDSSIPLFNNLANHQRYYLIRLLKPLNDKRFFDIAKSNYHKLIYSIVNY